MRLLPMGCWLALLLLPASSAAARPGGAARAESLAGARAVALAIPGALLDVAPSCGPAEPCTALLLLTALDGPRGPRSLLRFDLNTVEAPQELLRANLPERASRLAWADLDGDGAAELLLGEPGRLHRLAATEGDLDNAEPKLLLADHDLHLEILDRGGFLAPGRLDLPALGALRSFVVAPQGGLRPAGEVELPVRAQRGAAALTLTTPPVAALADGRFAVGPESFGDRRWRALLFDRQLAEPVEVWAELPGPEELRAARWEILDGRPVLIAATVSAGRVGVFEKQRLRLFAPRPDPTRAGVGPFFKARLENYRWQEAEPHLIDADADGRADLVVVQQSGLGGGKITVVLHSGRGGLGFDQTPRRMTLGAKDPRWSYGADVDGDGVPDLAILSGEELRIHSGMAGSGLLAKRPRWRLQPSPPESSLSLDREDAVRWRRHLESRDIDGDGRAEILLFGRRGTESLLFVFSSREGKPDASQSR